MIDEEKKRIANRARNVATRLPGSTFYNAAMFAIEDTLKLNAQPERRITITEVRDAFEDAMRGVLKNGFVRSDFELFAVYSDGEYMLGAVQDAWIGALAVGQYVEACRQTLSRPPGEQPARPEAQADAKALVKDMKIAMQHEQFWSDVPELHGRVNSFLRTPIRPTEPMARSTTTAKFNQMLNEANGNGDAK
jgi:hypothetical protein